LSLTNKEIAEYLGGLPEEKMHCSVMGQEALEAAIYSYKGIPLAHHEEDESALICRCFGITETRIKKTIKENNLATAEQVTNYIKAGGGCTTCLSDIDDLIASVWEGVEQEKIKVPVIEPETDTLPKLTNLQKITLIQKVLETEVKPFLAADGGDVELYDVEGDKVKVVLKGACGSCPSSTVTLKIAIEQKLQQLVLPSLVVESV